jgi:hypothetical protein
MSGMRAGAAAGLLAWAVFGPSAGAQQPQGGAGAEPSQSKAGPVGVRGTLIRITEAGPSRVPVGDVIEIDRTFPVTAGNPREFQVEVEGDRAAVAWDENLIITPGGSLPVDTLTIGAFLRARQPGRATIQAGFPRGPGGMLAYQIEVVRAGR